LSKLRFPFFDIECIYFVVTLWVQWVPPMTQLLGKLQQLVLCKRSTLFLRWNVWPPFLQKQSIHLVFARSISKLLNGVKKSIAKLFCINCVSLWTLSSLLLKNILWFLTIDGRETIVVFLMFEFFLKGD
jgi:hypothetical protein